ncbi:hypothetical protein GGR21_000128 [Dysgonomonas hofstadii]|uniref:F5/8 type C domain-containing protein n=1 Tax=Dysgonomonas hofstadii TaxID=637886 RepID=A0A840CR69_9BACT|nr:discoidin domain-containing protein [Dysgonomonas hofstadii]MBB4034243.1 hypothetical protein [Dysgonomonas hofstadii]
MKLKNKPTLLFIVGILLCGFFSCSDDSMSLPEQKINVARVTDVILTQAVNGGESLELNDVNAEINFVSQLTFDNKLNLWSNPTLEQTFAGAFDIEKENVTIVNDKDVKITSADITVDENNRLKIAFTKVDNSYSYMESSTITISVKAGLKTDLTDDDLGVLASTGYNGQATFYGEKADQNIKSNFVSVTSKIQLSEPYTIKGDLNNDKYKYQLNVIYFIPSDIKANPNFQRRISTILLKHQLFVMKWMKYWGYEEKSFGLPLDENGMVKVVVVNGKEKKADYPYDSSISVPKMKAEVEQHYTDNNLTWYSEHTLIVTATNGDVSETPFYGSGKWCYATDYEGMAYELYNIDPITGEAINPTPLTTNLIGGLLHELGHGLNAPHVGPTLSQKNDSQFGISLMGSGNTTYGKKPTFMHHTTAAIMNNCQLSATTDKTYYETTTGAVILEDPIIDGNNVTVKGSFTASRTVTDVIVRFYNSTETFLGGSSGYTSVAWVAKPDGNKFEITVPISELSVNTFKYKVGATILMDNGTTASVSLASIYRQENNTLVCETVKNDGTWAVITSHSIPVDDVANNFAAGLVDGISTTYMALVKPGKTYGGVTVAATESVWFTVNFKKQTEFNTITVVNRNFNVILNPKTVSFYGSNTNNGTDWVVIKKDVDLPDNKTNTIILDTPANYQYLKMTYDKWDTSGGSTMQITELELLNTK